MPLRNEGQSRSFKQNFTLAVLLAWVAGAVNASGFFVLGLHTSHMTGQVASIGESISRGEFELALASIKVLFAFVLGAALATALLDLTASFRRGRYTLALSAELAVLTSCGYWAWRNPGLRPQALIWSLAFAMGLQNAMVTRISGAVVRTTHLTGVLTDIGIELVRALHTVIERALSMLRGLGLRDVVGSPEPIPDFTRAWLHLALVISFLFGATMGPLVLWRAGGIALALPGVVLIGLVVLDCMPGSDARPRVQPMEAAASGPPEVPETPQQAVR